MKKWKKYKKAYELIKENVDLNNNDLANSLNLLEDLVKREQPKYPIRISKQYMYHFECPTCHRRGIYAQEMPKCMYCGQAFNWEKYFD